MKREAADPGRESVWDYPRPPLLERESRPARVVLAGEEVAFTEAPLRVLETSHPPGIYLPGDAFLPGVLEAHPKSTVCEYKGVASYWDICAGTRRATAAAWSYESPNSGFEAMAGYVSVYPSLVDACYLGDELVVAQDGDFYGGWITEEIVGPFKGAAGTRGW